MITDRQIVIFVACVCIIAGLLLPLPSLMPGGIVP